MARELNEGLASRGHQVLVVTTSLQDIHHGTSMRSTLSELGGVPVHALATPLRYRWMGITPTLPLWLSKQGRPDVVHLFGYRDVVTTVVGAWARRSKIPYILEPLGMFEPRLRKVRLKSLFDATVLRPIVRDAEAIVLTSNHEAQAAIAAGAPAQLIDIRGNGFPPVVAAPSSHGALRGPLGLQDEQLVLYVGRIAAGKGIELLLRSARSLPTVHFAFVGPDDGHGAEQLIAAAAADPVTAGRIHRLRPHTRPLELYADADVFVLASEGESFGMVAAEAAASGTPVVVTDRCGVAEVLGPRGALVVPYDYGEVESAIRRMLAEPELRRRLVAGAKEVAQEHAWSRIVDRQEMLYRRVVKQGG